MAKLCDCALLNIINRHPFTGVTDSTGTGTETSINTGIRSCTSIGTVVIILVSQTFVIMVNVLSSSNGRPEFDSRSTQASA